MSPALNATVRYGISSRLEERFYAETVI